MCFFTVIARNLESLTQICETAINVSLDVDMYILQILVIFKAFFGTAGNSPLPENENLSENVDSVIANTLTLDEW